MTTLETLKAARKMIRVESKWTQGEYMRDERGRSILSPGQKQIRSCCSIGALCVVTGKDPNEVEESSIVNPLKAVMGEDITIFNDFHTHAEVLAAFDAAIAKLEAA